MRRQLFGADAADDAHTLGAVVAALSLALASTHAPNNANVASVSVGVGTLSYIAPEVMTTVHYDAKADVYSFAVVLWELFSATPPFGNLAAAQVALAVCARGERPRPDPVAMPASLSEQMKRAWAERPTMAALVSALGAEMKKAVDPDDKHEDDSCVVPRRAARDCVCAVRAHLLLQLVLAAGPCVSSVPRRHRIDIESVLVMGGANRRTDAKSE